MASSLPEVFCRKKFMLIVSFVARVRLKLLGGDSQNFLGKFVRFFVTLGLKILRLFRLKVLFEAEIIKG